MTITINKIFITIVAILFVMLQISSALPENYTSKEIIKQPKEMYSLTPEKRDMLVRIHGSAFIIGWFGFILNGVFYMRYYKSFFETEKICGQKVWFQIHRIFNTLALLFTTLGIICILTAFNFEWTGPKINGKYNTSPGAIHSILGVFAYGLLVVQVLNSFLRCAPNDRNRKYFNWVHRILGMSSFLLATGTITIAAKFFVVHFTSAKNAQYMLYVFYGIILCCILVNEISLRLHFHKAMYTTLIIIFVVSIIVCSYICGLILASA
uniref:ascorbate ferrireductase (transmembrane) n=1 Tax=Parastrongyloides trichosuri TaxID=131310 RepID=A0A0N5A771_PARTI